MDGYRIRATVTMIAVDTLNLENATTEAEIRAKVAELGPKMRGNLLAAMREYADAAAGKGGE